MYKLGGILMKKKSKYILLFLITFLLISIAFGVNYGSTEEEDPLVTQSYVEMRIEQMKTYFQEQIDTLKKSVEGLKGDLAKIDTNTSGSGVFEPVVIKPGQKLIGGMGTELILRVGRAKAIANSQGGIVDVTGGIDIQDNKDIPKQHLLIIPRDDGRGIYSLGTGDTILMVKGSYKVE